MRRLELKERKMMRKERTIDNRRLFFVINVIVSELKGYMLRYITLNHYCSFFFVFAPAV